MTIDSWSRKDPRSGQMVDWDGNVVSETQSIINASDRDVAQSSRDGKLFRAFWHGTLGGNEIGYFILDIPVGTQIRGISRSQTLGDGLVDIKFAIADEYTASEYGLQGANMDELSTATTPCIFRKVTGPTIVATRDGTFHQSPTQNSRASSSPQTIAGAHTRHDSNTLPLFIYDNRGNEDFEMSISIIWQHVN